MAEKKIYIEDIDQRLLFGFQNSNLSLIESEFPVEITARGDWVYMQGKQNQIDAVEKVIRDIADHLKATGELTDRYIHYAIIMVKENGAGPNEQILDVEPLVFSLTTHQAIKPRTVGQNAYVQAIDKNDLVLSIGPAGTGKTYLAVAMAVMAFKQKLINRIILTRPAVEAGESLGYLPGDIRAKVDPFLRPLYDALHDMLDAEKIKKLIDMGLIEIAPLAFMRGRTLNSSFIILDEAQNTSHGQMKMFLTRIGQGSKAVITGDITQIDLEDKSKSGLLRVRKIIGNIKGIKFVELSSKDVVRHKLVLDIIKAYEKYESRKK
ncbi:MAG: PhoH family protein [candidate division Zixibacteria bacterium]|nr:PhoH family protein [candidate division Zixibacteria bacterium]